MSLDPRIRIVLGVALVGTVVALRTVPPTLLVTVAVLAGLAALGARRVLLPALRLSAPLVGLVLAVSVLALEPREVALTALRLLDLLLLGAAFFQLVGPDALAAALHQWRLPYPLVFVLTTSLRYVPLMRDRIARIRAAQRARGIDLRLHPRNLGRLAALLVPLLVQAFLLGERLAVAMEARGFARPGRTPRQRLRVQPWEYPVAAVGLAALGALLWWDRR